MSTTTDRSALIGAIQRAGSLAEAGQAVAELDLFDRQARTAAADSRAWDGADTIIRQTLTPVRTHEMHTAATDWIADFEAPVSGNAHESVIAEAAMWFGRTSPEVRADRDEFGAQAEGFMRRQASAYGEQADAIYSAGLSYLAFLHSRQAASGLPQIQQEVDSQDNPAATPLDPTVFDNFAPEVDPINAGVVGTETSERAPLLQEISGEGGGQGGPEVPGGHSIGNAGADGGNVAISHLYSMDTFRAQLVEAASGLDQIEQVVDPHDVPKPTPLETEVAFPWLITPDAYGNGGDTQEKGVAQSTAAGVRTSGHPPYRPQDHFTQGEVGEGYDTRDQCGYCGTYGPEGSMPKGLCNAHMDHRDDGREDDDRAREMNNDWGHESRRRSTKRVVADMFGNSDLPHAVPQPGVANSPETTPNPSAAYAEGVRDGQTGQAPTYADASSSAPDNVVQYSHGYADGAARNTGQQDMPASVQAARRVATVDFGTPGTGFNPAANSGEREFQQCSDCQGTRRGFYGETCGRCGGSGETRVKTATTLDTRVSSRFVKAAARSNGDFNKAYAYASKWKPGTPLVTTGSAEFESGLYAGIVDNPRGREAFTAAHRRMAKRDPQFASRMQVHASYTQHLADKGISTVATDIRDKDRTRWVAAASIPDHVLDDIESRDPAGYEDGPPTQDQYKTHKSWVIGQHGQAAWDAYKNQGRPDSLDNRAYPEEYRSVNQYPASRKHAGTSTDLDTLAPAASPSQTGVTPINGPGTVPILDGGMDAAAPGGPAPYNGAPPYGAPVVPQNRQAPSAGSQYVDDTLGGPVDGNSKPNEQTLAFRRQVQANLLTQAAGQCVDCQDGKHGGDCVSGKCACCGTET